MSFTSIHRLDPMFDFFFFFACPEKNVSFTRETGVFQQFLKLFTGQILLKEVAEM